MSKERYNQIVDEGYKKYADSHEYFVDGWLHVIPMVHNKETFVNECKNDSEFSEKWGLKIGYKELSISEREMYWRKDMGMAGIHYYLFSIHGEEGLHEEYDKQNVPRKLITITYNNETIEIYE